MELIRALGALTEPPAPEHAAIAHALGLGSVPDSDVFTDVFLFHLYPYASVHLSPEGMLGGEPRDRIAGFWRALGYTPPAEPDHLAALLGLWAELEDSAEQESRPAERSMILHARTSLLGEHLLSWLPAFLYAVRRWAPPYYRRWAELLQETVDDVTEEFDVEGLVPAHFAFLPELVDPRREGGERFLDAVLAPGRSGMIVARADLAAAARELGLGFRLGERKYQLRALVSQDPGPVLAWLAKRARKWAEWHVEAPWHVEATRAHWRSRAEGTAALLDELAVEAWRIDRAREPVPAEEAP